LRRHNEQLSVGLRNATEKAAEAQARLEELRTRECPACEVLKQTLNFHVLAAGSKVGVFDGLGPTLPKPAPRDTPEQPEPLGKQRASRLAHQQRSDYIQQFMQSEAQIPIDEESQPS
jgi:hypothetical protein